MNLRSVKEAVEAALEREQGWSSGDDNSDGGAALLPQPFRAPGSKKAAPWHRGGSGKPAERTGYTAESWRHTTGNAQSAVQGDSRDGRGAIRTTLPERLVLPHGEKLVDATMQTSLSSKRTDNTAITNRERVSSTASKGPSWKERRPEEDKLIHF